MTEEIRIEPYLYQFKEKIGDGGFGRVFKGNEIFSDELVAIKVLNPEEMNEQSLQRFQREIRIHSQLKHPHIVPIINFELDDGLESDIGRGLAYYTMPLARENLRTFLIEYREINLGNMDDETAVFYFTQILDGIEYAHEKEIIHRDLKPENILVYNEDGNDILKISDFGLGKFLNGKTNLTRTQVGLGSDVYAAPEQYADSREVDERADIFSLGKILYELITYDLPVTIDLDKISNSKLKFIVRKATQSNVDRRFRSIQEMKDRINMVMGLNNAFKTSTSQFNIIYEKYNTSSEHIYLKEIADLLNKHHNDYILYTENFMNMDELDLAIMATFYEEELFEVAENYLSLLQGDHEFNLTDKIANFVFYVLLPEIQNNLDLYEKAIESVLTLGHRHNRYYIARIFGEEISAVTNDNHIMIIGEVLSNNARASRWAKQYFSNHQFCDFIRFNLEKV
ncbi:serine/threonine-protein kinase [Peribacillus simplex]